MPELSIVIQVSMLVLCLRVATRLGKEKMYFGKMVLEPSNVDQGPSLI